MLKRTFFIAGLMIVSFVSLIYFYKLGVAHSFYTQANESLSTWNKQGKITNQEGFDSALNAINKAINVYDGDPHNFHVKANILDWGIYSGMLPKTHYGEAKQALMLSTELRNDWPGTWVDLARINSYADGVNSETLSYINNAFEVGPFDKAVLVGTLEILLRNWYSLDTASKALYFDTLKRSASDSRVFRQVMEEAKFYNLASNICIQIRYDKHFKQYKNTWLERKYCNA